MRRRALALVAGIALSPLATSIGCGDRGGADSTTAARSADAGARPAWFAEVAAKSGFDFVHQSGQRERFDLPTIMGGGVALFDMDNDGALDIYAIQAGSLDDETRRPGNRLFRNTGNGSFSDVTAGSGAQIRGYGMGVAAGDYNNDGTLDLYVTAIGRNALLRNDGGGHFTDVTAGAGVGSGGWSTSATFLDYDGDGWLDLFVLHYLNWSPPVERVCFSVSGARDYCDPTVYRAPTAATLYRNNGDGSFADVSERAGVSAMLGHGLGVVAIDFDGDGRQDVFVANDRTPNRLWMNQGGGRFVDRALIAGCAIDQDARPKAGMGVTAADVDDDSDEDVLVVNLNGESDSFYRNDKGACTDDTIAAGLRTAPRPFTRFGVGFVDFDNDGRLDLYEANGRVGLQSVVHSSDPYAEPNLLFRGTASGRFEEVVPRGGTAAPLLATSRAAAFGDLDNDGGIDVVVVNRDAQAYLLRNVVPQRGHWVLLRVLDEHGRDAFGATVRMTVGARRVSREVRASYSYLASNDPRVHIGLGGEAAVRDVSVKWIDGSVESFNDIAADRIETLRRGRGSRTTSK